MLAQLPMKRSLPDSLSMLCNNRRVRMKLVKRFTCHVVSSSSSVIV
jgi:hypothetical protein